MPMLMNKHRFALLVALTTVAAPLAAHAQRKSPLADAPAIRKRFELRQTRFEIGVGAGTTINQDFYHTVLVDVRLAFHITDWLSLAGFLDFGAAQISTGFENRVVTSLGTTPSNVNREPLNPSVNMSDNGEAGLQQITGIYGGQLEFTPFTGKYSLAGKFFAAYDFYLFVGGAGINVKPVGPVTRTCDQAPSTDVTQPSRYVCGVSGIKPGPTFGVGFHTFFGQGVALAFEFRDVMAQLNPSGRDVNGDQVADNNDLAWTHTYTLTGSLVVYLPFNAKISP
jgi:outer membrane beta-barrel protein